MADQQLRDASNRLIGTISTLSSGQLEIRDSANKRLGTYDPKTDQTRDTSNRVIGNGNLLTTLL
jgi:hypothetical protein